MGSPALLITACDAGTANFLVPVLPRLPRFWRLLAHGPAADIFERHGLSFERFDEALLDQSPDWADLTGGHTAAALLAGTSWGMTVDKVATLAARRAGIRSAAIIEHWSIYRERLSRVQDGHIIEPDLYLPDRIWVVDGVAMDEAGQAGLPRDRLVPVGQPHLEAQRVILANVPNRGRQPGVVYVSERIGTDYPPGSPLYLGFDEFSVLEDLIGVLPADRPLTIKFHPQEYADKYDAILAASGRSATLVGRCDIPTLIHEAGTLVGMVSMLLLEAALVRDDVISFMPGGRPDAFIGNRIGATRAATDTHALRRWLDGAESVRGGDFGSRFDGSAERVCAVVKEFVECV